MTPALTLLLLAGCGETAKLSAYNMPPTVSITAPVDGSAVGEGARIDFTGLVTDGPTPPPELALLWSSDLSGPLDDTERADSSGVVVFSTASLAPGTHVVSLTAADPQGEEGVASVTVTVNAHAEVLEPAIEIIRPTAGQQGAVDTPFPFLVHVSDAQDAPDALRVTFESDLDGVFCELTPDVDGNAGCYATLSPNDGDPSVDIHHLTFTVTDSSGLSAYALFDFYVVRVDADGDGYSPDADDAAFVDCDDTDASIHPGAGELCNGVDDDCDGTADEPGAADGVRLYEDADGDGYGSSTGAGMVLCAEDGLYTTVDNTDCNDANALVSPGVPEACFDSLDNDCDRVVDEGDGAIGASIYYPDNDRDTFGAAGSAGVPACVPTAPNDALDTNDCDDGSAMVFPGQWNYFSAPRANGSYDYNCDSVQEPRYVNQADCSWNFLSCDIETGDEGWTGSAPACGQSGSWSSGEDGCNQSGLGCSLRGNTTMTQACR